MTRKIEVFSVTEEWPSLDAIRCVVDADLDSGLFVWKRRTPDQFTASRLSAEATCLAWNIKYAGKPAFATNSGGGYLSGTIFRRVIKTHRLVWALAHDAWPEGFIDHINGIVSDNRLANLRAVSRTENARNQGIGASNRSGVLGVYWRAKTRRWDAIIGVDGRQKHIGSFVHLDDAKKARRMAELAEGYHENHGQRLSARLKATKDNHP